MARRLSDCHVSRLGNGAVRSNGQAGGPCCESGPANGAALRMRTKNVRAALDVVDAYLAQRAATLFAPIIDHLREVGEARSCGEIESHFRRNFDVCGVTTACEYLADQGLIAKAATAVRLTKKSNIEVQELAFVYTGEVPDEF